MKRLLIIIIIFRIVASCCPENTYSNSYSETTTCYLDSSDWDIIIIWDIINFIIEEIFTSFST